jgi:hypothetical protein
MRWDILVCEKLELVHQRREVQEGEKMRTKEVRHLGEVEKAGVQKAEIGDIVLQAATKRRGEDDELSRQHHSLVRLPIQNGDVDGVKKIPGGTTHQLRNQFPGGLPGRLNIKHLYDLS